MRQKFGVLKNQVILKMFKISFVKKYLKLPTCTTNALACGECGRYPLYVDDFL